MSYPLNKLQRVEKAQLPAGFVISAPVSGHVQALDNIDHPLLNSGMLGEGIAIELSGNKLTAPFDGTITELPGSGHRIAFRATNGIKLLLLFGHHNQQLMGHGFNAKVSTGQTVTRGQQLASFNLQQWQNLNPQSPPYAAVFITNPELIGHIYCAANKVTAAEDLIFTLTAKKKHH